MKRFSAVLSVVWIAALSLASEEWVRVYLNGGKIGYSSSQTEEKGLNGGPASHTVSYSLIKASLLGSVLEMDTESTMCDAVGNVTQIECRDHAILSASIMRAAGIPTRMVSGMVFTQGQFFYHAWVEVFDGARWIGFDSTRPESRLSATHIKTGQGTIQQAYSSFLLDEVKFEVLNVKGKRSK